jgi:hypothetical protein
MAEDPWSEFKPAPPQGNDPWAEFKPARPSWSQAIGNIPSDVAQTVREIASVPGAIGTALSNPGRTAMGIASAVGQGVTNQARQLAGAFTFGNVGETTDEAVARKEAERKQAIERPLTTVANIALSGLPSGELTAGQGILKATTAGVREAANIPTFLAAGVGRKSSNTMLEAGKLGGAEGAAARAQMVGGNPMPVANQALNAAGQLAADKNAAYLADAQRWNVPGVMADVGPTQQALADALAKNRTGLGAVESTQTEKALQEIQSVLDRHTTAPGGGKVGGLNIEDADKLKKAIGEVMYNRDLAPQGSKARALTVDIYDAAKGAVAKVSPEYSAAMEKSQGTIQNLKDLRQELSLKENAGKATILGKLQSAMRNDVSSRFGARSQMLDQLATKEPTLPYALAGQDFSSWYPRGLSKLVPGMGGVGAGYAALTGTLNPATLAIAPLALAASSPRLQGELRYLAGLLTRGAGNAGLTQKNIGRGIEASRLAGLLMNQQGAQ